MQSPNFTTSTEAVRHHITYAQGVHGITRKEIADALGCGVNYIAMLRSKKNPALLPPHQILPFVRVCRISDANFLKLTRLRFLELGLYPLLAQFSMKVRNLDDPRKPKDEDKNVEKK